ncbi:MAG: TRAP transporter small permease [Sphaerochaetaceae bacterium]|jgi:TRAP-type C4-dicarboxylate transport system permease small subunit|nr:TRAP transporter small permease [Sphaerochaetaceae bacterium]NLO61059.1 TRAP transporter small permease [Spirochaetales bacterium]MDD2406677.1 TRAP transporter small permease [Sphaerochaetaceae bacterium]MDD3671339.1 TRAP transporter small permease [Sphaerochaetaceae bacterium]MDD4259297.1 TRAP transporter small permease [Sphaerochaetaceae bacterium]
MRKFYEKVCKIEVILSAVFLSISCLLIFIAAIARSMDNPINWSQDLSLFLFAWSVFLAADVALRNDKLVRMELVLLKTSEKTTRIVTIINYLLIVVFLAALTFYGIKLSFISHRRVFQGIPGFSYTWVILCVPIGCSLMIVTSVLKLKDLLSPKKSTETQKEA